jgi:xanthine dehydrogenase large subunit
VRQDQHAVNTAFRGFGGPQGALAIEYILDDIARNLGRDPLEVRRNNFYGPASRGTGGATSPTTARRSKTTSSTAGRPAERSSRYQERRRAVAAFNAGSPVLKKGLALTPVKFGISFNVPHLNQAGRWCMSIPTARCWSTTAAPRWARA